LTEKMENRPVRETMDAGAMLAELWRGRLLLAAIVCVGCVLALAATFLVRPTWRATTAIVPAAALEDGGGGGALAALQGAAGSLGLNLGGGGEGVGDLLPRILRSRTVLGRVLDRTYVMSDGNTDTLGVWIDPAGSSAAARRDAALRKLRGAVRAGVDARTGVISISATLTDPVLAAAVANACVEELDAFTRSARNAHSGRRESFVAGRLEEVGDQLEAAEEKLRDFRMRNRSIAGSPQLMLEEGRLIREVEVAQRIFLELKAQFEMARIDQARDVPLVIILDEATPPVRKHGPRRGRLLVSAFILCGLAASLLVLIRAERRRRNTGMRRS